ncbi:MAG TPA: IS630 family transposase [Phormidium sp.]
MRKRPKGKPDAALYQVRKQALALLEQQSRQGSIDLFYGDESQVAEEGYVPYGWQFAQEEVSIQVAKGGKVNLFGLISRSNQFFYQTCRGKMTAHFVVEHLDTFSLSIQKPTVVVLDNAKIHTARQVQERLAYWQARGLYLFYLPPYSPHLNICERVWKELKARWLKPQDYLSVENLFYTVSLALAAIGKELFINFSDFYL